MVVRRRVVRRDLAGGEAALAARVSCDAFAFRVAPLDHFWTEHGRRAELRHGVDRGRSRGHRVAG